MSGQSFWFKRVKWEMPSCSEEHFRDGWRCKEAAWWSWVEHWSSEAHQYYSPCPFGIVGTGGTGSFLKPLWAFFHGRREILTPIRNIPCCAMQCLCGSGHVWVRLLWRISHKNRQFFKGKKSKFHSFCFFLGFPSRYGEMCTSSHYETNTGYLC